MLTYQRPVYRPPSEANSLIVQATIGCSWNHCIYCANYRNKQYRERPIDEVLAELEPVAAASAHGQLPPIERIFVADGDALAMPTESWVTLLAGFARLFPRLTRVSSYATAGNITAKTAEELRMLRELGLALVYIGPESGDDVTLKAIAKGATFDDHVEAAARCHAAGMAQSLMFLLGAGGRERSLVHARESARLASAMNPRYVSLLTLIIEPGTPLQTLYERGRFELPDVDGLLEEIHSFLLDAAPQDALFRSNHSSNHLPLAGSLPRDRTRLLAEVEAARSGERALRPAWARGR